MESRKILPPTHLLVAAVAMMALHFLLPVTRLIPLPSNVVAILPLTFGIVINLAIGNAPKRAKTTVKPFEKWAAPVTNGVQNISMAGMPPAACCREVREQGR